MGKYKNPTNSNILIPTMIGEFPEKNILAMLRNVPNYWDRLPLLIFQVSCFHLGFYRCICDRIHLMKKTCHPTHKQLMLTSSMEHANNKLNFHHHSNDIINSAKNKLL